MTEQEKALKDLRFIRNGYKNLAENGADGYRAVGKGVDCSVEVKTNKDLYSHYVVALDMAISALEKQIAKKPIIKPTTKEKPKTHRLGRLLCFHCPTCGRFLIGLYETDVERGGGISREMKGCSTCLQAIDFSGYYTKNSSKEKQIEDKLSEEIRLE